MMDDIKSKTSTLFNIGRAAICQLTPHVDGASHLMLTKLYYRKLDNIAPKRALVFFLCAHRAVGRSPHKRMVQLRDPEVPLREVTMETGISSFSFFASSGEKKKFLLKPARAQLDNVLTYMHSFFASKETEINRNRTQFVQLRFYFDSYIFFFKPYYYLTLALYMFYIFCSNI